MQSTARAKSHCSKGRPGRAISHFLNTLRWNTRERQQGPYKLGRVDELSVVLSVSMRSCRISPARSLGTYAFGFDAVVSDLAGAQPWNVLGISY